MSNTRDKVVAAAVLALAGLATIALLRRSPSADAPGSEARAPSDPSPDAKDPRLVLSRPWFDKLPRKRTDEIDLWIFFGGGIGLEDRGSMWRSTIDFFEFERQGSKLDVVFLQDKKKQPVRFEIVACSDKPPFDLCLDLQDPLRGHKRLWSWDDDADMDANVPWARQWRDSAEKRARGRE